MMRSGYYALFLTFLEDAEAEAGRLGRISVRRGEYCYIGSARNGLDQRLGRHLSPEKKKHWHIDSLTMLADSMEAYETPFIGECGLRDRAEDSGMVPWTKGFGCSDCGCDTHLLSSDARSKEEFIRRCGLSRFRGV